MSINASKVANAHFKVKSFLLSTTSDAATTAKNVSIFQLIDEEADKEIDNIISNQKITNKNNDTHESLFTPDSLDSSKSNIHSSESSLSSSPTGTSNENILIDDSPVTLTKFVYKNNNDDTLHESNSTISTSTEPSSTTSSSVNQKKKEESNNNDVIKDKIRKISQLQNTINDISSKIKSIDVNKTNYYCLQNEGDLQIDDVIIASEQNQCQNQNTLLNTNSNSEYDLILNEKFDDYDDFFESNNEIYVDEVQLMNSKNDSVNIKLEIEQKETDKRHDSDENDDDDDDDSDDDYDDDLKNLMQYKQAKPATKIITTNNIYFTNKSRFLDPIDEMDEETDLNENLVFSYNSFKISELNVNTNTKENNFITKENVNIKKPDKIEKPDTLPEDNVERLRNIRDMFENSDSSNNEVELQKVEKLQPSDKIKQRLTNDHDFEDLVDTSNYEEDELDNDDYEDEYINKVNLVVDNENLNDDENSSVDSSLSSSLNNLSTNDITNPNMVSYSHDYDNKRFEEGIGEEDSEESKHIQKEPVITFTELNTVKNKFEKQDDVLGDVAPKPIRAITPPRDARREIENQPLARPAEVVSSEDRFDEVMPESGTTRSRREIFQNIGDSSLSSNNDSVSSKPRVKSITPPREDKRVFKEKTPERNENVLRESDRHEDALPSAGSAKQTAALFAGASSNGSLSKSIERSGITIEGELAEKGIAKSRLAIFNSGSVTPVSSNKDSINEIEEIKNASGIAKDRLNLFKNLEQQATRSSPPKETKKLKEFTPPPQLDAHQLQQRQYIIVDKEANDKNEALREAQNIEEYVPESGLAKNRMKQYLETATTSLPTNMQQTNGATTTNENGEELPGKGTAKSLLAKWKSIENVKDKETSPDHVTQGRQRTISRERQHTPPVNTVNQNDSNNETECLPQSGIAKNLLNKWQNIEKDVNGGERRSVRPITPPPNQEEETGVIERGFAKNALAKFQQSVAETNTNVRKTVTPPKEVISSSNTANRVIYESTPVESNINSQYNNDEDVIPAAGLAKQLKSKFQVLEKESTQVETSSSKLNYTPKRFTSSAAPKQSNGNQNGSANGNGDKCCLCEKTVYAMEKIEADKKLYHKLCFKCSVCNCTLKLGNFSSIKEKLYCTPHYIQLFARNGNYDEGFGLENYKKKWLKA